MEPERRTLVVHQPQLKPVTEDRNARRAEQRRLGDQLGDQVEDHGSQRHPREYPPFAAGQR
jgi:hypothetical protein